MNKENIQQNEKDLVAFSLKEKHVFSTSLCE